MATIQKIKLPMNYDPPQFFCPACGAPILGNFDTQICKHVVIVTDLTGHDYDAIGEKYTQVFDAISEEVEKTNEDIVEKFLEKNDKESFLKFDIEFGGLSHSVDFYNVSAVFDFAP